MVKVASAIAVDEGGERARAEAPRNVALRVRRVDLLRHPLQRPPQRRRSAPRAKRPAEKERRRRPRPRPAAAATAIGHTAAPTPRSPCIAVNAPSRLPGKSSMAAVFSVIPNAPMAGPASASAGENHRQAEGTADRPGQRHQQERDHLRGQGEKKQRPQAPAAQERVPQQRRDHRQQQRRHEERPVERVAERQPLAQDRAGGRDGDAEGPLEQCPRA